MNKELEALKRIGVLEIKNNISFGYTVGYGGIVIASTKDYRIIAEALTEFEKLKTDIRNYSYLNHEIIVAYPLYSKEEMQIMVDKLQEISKKLYKLGKEKC